MLRLLHIVNIQQEEVEAKPQVDGRGKPYTSPIRFKVEQLERLPATTLSGSHLESAQKPEPADKE